MNRYSLSEFWNKIWAKKYSLLSLFLVSNCLLLIFLFIMECIPMEYMKNPFDTRFNSDVLFSASLLKDIIEDGGSIKDWIFPHYTAFFPDMLIEWFWYFIFDGDMFLIFIAYAFTIFLLLFIINYYIFQSFFSRQESFYLSCIIISFNAYYLSKYYYLFYPSMGPSQHGGSIICVLLSVLLLIKLFNQDKKHQSGYGMYILFFIINLLGAFSDRLYISIFQLPLGIVLLFLWLLSLIPLRKTMILIGVIIFSSVIAELSLHFSIQKIEVSPFFISFDILKANIKDLLFLLHTMTYKENLLLLGIVLFFMASTLILFLLREKYSKEKYMLHLMVLMTYMIGFFVVFISSIFFYHFRPRYIFPSSYLLFIHTFLFIPVFFSSNRKQVVSITSLLITLFFIANSWGRIQDSINDVNSRKHFRKELYPPLTQCLDKLAQKYDIEYGISTYWQEKITRYTSKQGLKVVAYTKDLVGFHCNKNLTWYRDQYDFAIISFVEGTSKHTLDRDKIILNNGQPIAIEECNTRQNTSVDDIYFGKNEEDRNEILIYEKGGIKKLK